jgi:drug/metabolite transporter (DMT)-like permease
MHNSINEGKTPGRAAVVFAMAAVYLFWGGTFLGMRLALQTIPPFLMAGVRFSIAGWGLYAARRLMGDPRPTLTEWRGAGVVGALLFLGGNGMVVWAEMTIPSSIASIIVATVPLWMAAIGYFARLSRPGLGGWIGVAVGFSGILVLVLGSGSSPSGALNPLGIAALLLGAVSWAGGSLLSRRTQQPQSPLLWTSMQMIMGGALLLLFSLAMGDYRSFDPARLSVRSIIAFCYLVTLGSVVGFTAYIWLLKHVEPTVVSTYAFVNPIVAVFLGYVIASERIGGSALIAAGIIVCAVGIITLWHPRPAKS